MRIFTEKQKLAKSLEFNSFPHSFAVLIDYSRLYGQATGERSIILCDSATVVFRLVFRKRFGNIILFRDSCHRLTRQDFVINNPYKMALHLDYDPNHGIFFVYSHQKILEYYMKTTKG